MKDKILNALKSKTFFALAINIVIMALIIVVTAFSYDSADDFYNSLYICQYHNYYNNDINYIFATITGSLQYILLNFNCFVLFQILLSCAAFSSVTFVFADKFGKHKAFIFTLVLNILFSFDHYSNILSSKTAALLLTAGFLMALNAIRNKGTLSRFGLVYLKLYSEHFYVSNISLWDLHFLLHSSSVI